MISLDTNLNANILHRSYRQSTGGIQYVPGGAASGFKHVVKDQYTTRLLQVKGKLITGKYDWNSQESFFLHAHRQPQKQTFYPLH